VPDCYVPLLLDECTDPKIAAALRDLGYDAVHVQELDRKSTKDRPLLVAAAEMGRAIATYNAGDFSELHSEFLAGGLDHAGLIVSEDYKTRIGAYLSDLRHTLQVQAKWYGEGDGWIRNKLVFVMRAPR
jgi:predicted nuclease of predicted toxin-antitoxin system